MSQSGLQTYPYAWNFFFRVKPYTLFSCRLDIGQRGCGLENSGTRYPRQPFHQASSCLQRAHRKDPPKTMEPRCPSLEGQVSPAVPSRDSPIPSSQGVYPAYGCWPDIAFSRVKCKFHRKMTGAFRCPNLQTRGCFLFHIAAISTPGIFKAAYIRCPSRCRQDWTGMRLYPKKVEA